MLPSILSQQIQRGTADFLRTTFPPSNPFFHGILERFLEREAGGMFKGPYVSMKLPFRPGSLSLDTFSGFTMAHTPYAHQEKAFGRLHADPKSTLISTGTGSGKTECFLYPVLEHCYRHRGEPGIKAILVYPMNALASDQARRLAEEIHGSERLRGSVRAGLFVGGTPAGEEASGMSATGIITSKEAMRKHPPDILLTNYKMLDYLLIRPLDFPLWQDNGPETLKFFVVDELHTFDGAQGTDLACLIRRVKERVRTPEAHLCCVGTSATLGGRDDLPGLREFAEQLFGESFDEDSVVTEDLLSPSEFFGETYLRRSMMPMGDAIPLLNPDGYADEDAYLSAQIRIWFRREVEDPQDKSFRLELADLLMEHMLFRNLVLVLKSETLALDELSSRLGRIQAEFEDYSPGERRWILMSLLGLVSLARRGTEQALRPFLQVRTQLWVRELRRMLGSVAREPALRFADDLPVDAKPAHLPLLHCRECGSMGWTAIKRANDSHLSCELSTFYRAFFEERSPNVHFVFPAGMQAGDRQQKLPQYLCGDCLELGHGEAPGRCRMCGAEGTCIPVELFNPVRNTTNNRTKLKHDCPYCHAHESMTLLGSRAASLLAVGIGQLFATPFYPERPKRLLAFSNSVQDASHRAGFFEARTYGFNFRSALRKVIAGCESPPALDELPVRFRDYWMERMSEEEFLATFLAPNLAWREEAEAFLTGASPASAELKTLVAKRIDWEIWSELCFRARIGRTLEKSGVAASAFDPERMGKAEALLLDRLPNEVGVLNGIRGEQLRPFLFGFLHQVRVRGGVEHPDLGGYVRDWGNTWLLNRVGHLPAFGSYSRAPAFPTTKPKVDRFDAMTSQGSSDTWAESWLQRSLGRAFPAVGSFSAEIYREVLRALVDAGVLMEWMEQDPQVWGIRRDALRIETGAVQLSCDTCGQSATSAASELTLWEGHSCRRFGCEGNLRVTRREADYYGRLYRDGLVNRIYSAEHTGLLQREVREEVEKQFMRQELPASPNLLSCTPTLEMGINIGDLSSLLLCGIPPGQANYLQRIGRSGRRDGNAFNLALAEGKPHDLYFYHDPLEMVAGAVDPPGVFLNAPMVLERQFMGFCFDRWIETGISLDTFPRKMSLVLRNMGDAGNPALFPYNLLAFIDTSRTPLLERFLKIFGDSLTGDAQAQLRRFVEGDSEKDEGNLNFKILDRLSFLLQEVESFRKRVKAVQKAIRDREKSPAQDQNTPKELEDLQKEKAALNRMIHALRNKETFNFFTDEGLLPNYAFPEAGVTLRSVIWRRRSRVEDGKGKYDTRVYEYVRPAALALRELAPANTFYAESRKVRVDRVSLDLAEVESWRFCSECSHAERVLGPVGDGACPKCGDPLWADGGQVRTMVRIRQVEARTEDAKSRVDDSSETREPLYYNQQMQVEVSPEHIERAYGLEDADTPFGYEFIRKAEFRDINFGLGGEQQTCMKVAGQDVPVQGFEVCTGCGKVRPGPNKAVEHAITCRYYGSDKEAPCVNSLYLYRQFTSEAVRILLPVTSEGVDVKLHSFVAAVYLGLRKRFRGGIDHLQTAIMDEPVPDSAARKRFLVIYDSVPGGTGYLKELTKTPDTMLEVLDTALVALRKCACEGDEEKDGCYHCLYAFRLSRDMANISRREAMELLSGILSRKDQLRERKSVTDLSINGLLESELEARFIEALRRMRHGQEPVQLVKDVVRGKPGWQLTVAGRTWQVEPQPRLGESDGVSVACRPDFILWPLRQGGVRPVALFTDGFQYHADIESDHLIVERDVEKRMAILRADKYRVWSVSWEDVTRSLSNEEPEHVLRWMQKGLSRGLKLFDPFESRTPGVKALAGLVHAGTLRGLVAYLASSTEEPWTAQAFFHSLSFGDPDFGMVEADEAEAFGHRLFTAGPWSQIELKKPPDSVTGTRFMGIDLQEDELSRPLVARWTSVDRAKAKPEHLREMDVAVRLFDDPDIAHSPGFQKSWNTFLQMMNFLQFLPGARFATSRGLEAHRDYRSTREASAVAAAGFIEASTEWEEEGRFVSPEMRGFWKELHTCGFPLPMVGYELTGSNGEVLGQAEIAWPDARLAILLPEAQGEKDVFAAKGWRTHEWKPEPSTENEFVKTLLSKLKEDLAT